MKLENYKVIGVLPLEEGVSAQGNAWKKQVYIVEEQDKQYPKKVAVECMGRKADEIKLEMDQVVTLNIDIESREANGRWFTSVKAWGVEGQPAAQPAEAQPAQVQQPAAKPMPQQAPVQPAPVQPAAPADGNTDLLF